MNRLAWSIAGTSPSSPLSADVQRISWSQRFQIHWIFSANFSYAYKFIDVAFVIFHSWLRRIFNAIECLYSCKTLVRFGSTKSEKCLFCDYTKENCMQNEYFILRRLRGWRMKTGDTELATKVWEKAELKRTRGNCLRWVVQLKHISFGRNRCQRHTSISVNFTYLHDITLSLCHSRSVFLTWNANCMISILLADDLAFDSILLRKSHVACPSLYLFLRYRSDTIIGTQRHQLGYSHWYLYGIWFELLHKTQCDQFTACSQLRRSTYSMQLGHFQAIFINFRRISRSRKVPMNGHILKVSFAKQFPLWISSDLIFILENRKLLWIYCTAIQNGVAHLGCEVIQNSQMNPISERNHPNF